MARGVARRTFLSFEQLETATPNHTVVVLSGSVGSSCCRRHPGAVADNHGHYAMRQVS